MGQSILEGTLHQGQSIGEAVNQAKTQQNKPESDQQLGDSGGSVLRYNDTVECQTSSH